MSEQQIVDWLGSQREAMLGLIEDVVNIDGGSYDKAGVDAVAARFERFFAEHGIATRRERKETHGDILFASVGGPGGSNRPIVLMGHRDTVFPKDEPKRRPFKIEGSRAYGPGVADMKAGLVMNAFVLAAFAKYGGAPAPLLGLYTSDEEIASPSSRPVIEREAKNARAVLNSEPGRPGGNIVTSRKGGVFMVFEVTGKAAHSGANFEAGISAIGELAHKVVELHKLTDLKRGITVNVGLVSGGQSVNTTAPWAQGQIDLRYVKPAERAEMLKAIGAIIEKSFVSGTTAKLEIRGEFLPLNANEASDRLFTAYQAAAADLGVRVEGEFTGGCADSGFTAGVGCPTLCALGPVGGRVHTAEEYLEVDTVVPRAQILAKTILRM